MGPEIFKSVTQLAQEEKQGPVRHTGLSVVSSVLRCCAGSVPILIT